MQVDTHNGIRKVMGRAFFNCKSLRRINLKSVVEIDGVAFYHCRNLESVEFDGDKIETIGNYAFDECFSLSHLKLPSIVTIGHSSFSKCDHLTDVELSERLETIGASAFKYCERLQRIAIPLKRDLIPIDIWQEYSQFKYCDPLVSVRLVGGTHKTVASLHMESWKTEMTVDINRINQVLPSTDKREKTEAIKRWMDSVIDKMDHYKSEHCRYVKEGITLLELALWKANLGEKDEVLQTAKQRRPKLTLASQGKRNVLHAVLIQ